jgi:polysaccharide pyruvyl transferase WcaK-like protein
MIYHVFANRSNIGDWLSARGIQKLLSPLEITECLCDVPFIDETMQQLASATEKDLIVIGGGGLLMDYFTPFWEAFQPVAARVPFTIWGIGYCDLKLEYTLPPGNLITSIINKSKLCIVRDELTRSHLPNCNLYEPIPCPSINVIDRVSIIGKDILHVDNYTTAGEVAYEAMCTAGKDFANQHKITYRQTNNRITKDSEKELQQILSLYRQSGYVLSSALHGCIIAVAMGLKVLAVSGDRKIEGFMESVGLQDWVLDIGELEKIPEYLEKLHLQNSGNLDIEKIQKKNQQVAEAIKDIYAFLQ